MMTIHWQMIMGPCTVNAVNLWNPTSTLCDFNPVEHVSVRLVTRCRQAQYCLCWSLACLYFSQRRNRKHHQSSPQLVYLLLSPLSVLPAGSLQGCRATGWVWRELGWWPPRYIMFPLQGKVGDPCSGSWGSDWLRMAGYAGCHLSSWSCDPLSLCGSFQRSWS